MDEKRIEYKAKRKLLMAILFFSVGITWLFAIAITPFSVTSYEDIIMLAVALLIVSIITVGIAFAVGYINVKTYVFTKDGIDVLRGGKRIHRYERNDIRELRYVTLSPKYFVWAFDYKARKGASWCLYVFTKNGQKKSLFWFNADMAKKLQTELYGKLVVIF